MSRGEVALHWRGRLDSALAGLEDPRVAHGGAAPQPREARVSAAQAGAACAASALAPDPARFDEAGRFREAVFTATREVAIVALRSSAPQLQPARGIVDATLADPDSLRPSLAEWLGELDEGGLAALRSAAVSWVIDARALAARRGAPDWHEPRALAHTPGPLRVTITAHVDARRPADQPGAGPHLMVIRPRSSSRDARIAHRTALLWALVRGEVPSSVVLGIRDTMQRVGFRIDDARLGEAVNEAAQDIAEVLAGEEASRSPGPQCRHCRILATCAAGATWLGSGSLHWRPGADQSGAGRWPEPTM